MKRKLYQLFPLIGLCLLIEGCQPDVEKPSIENCLLKKIDAVELVSSNASTGSSLADINSTSTVFSYDNNSRPTTFSYYNSLTLNSYTKVIYNADGTLLKGTDYTSSDQIEGTQEYVYDKSKQLTQRNYYDNDDIIYAFKKYEYNTKGMLNLSTSLNADYDNLTFYAYSFRYEYDNKNNLVKRFSHYLSRDYDSSNEDFLEDLLSDLKKTPEVLINTLAGYDDNFNPYRSQSTLAILFDDLPAYNNPKTISYYYRDTGVKYLDYNYSYEYNKKGFPYIYTYSADYTNEYTKRTGVPDYTSTSSFEYVCK